MNTGNQMIGHSSEEEISNWMEIKKQAIQFFETLKDLVEDIFDSVLEDEEACKNLLKERKWVISWLISDLETIRYIYAWNTKSVWWLDLDILGKKVQMDASRVIWGNLRTGGSYFEATPMVIREFLSHLEKGQVPTILELQLLNSVVWLTNGLWLPLLINSEFHKL